MNVNISMNGMISLAFAWKSLAPVHYMEKLEDTHYFVNRSVFSNSTRRWCTDQPVLVQVQTGRSLQNSPAPTMADVDVLAQSPLAQQADDSAHQVSHILLQASNCQVLARGTGASLSVGPHAMPSQRQLLYMSVYTCNSHLLS